MGRPFCGRNTGTKDSLDHANQPGLDAIVRVLVTGASGFIGRYLLPRLIGAGHDVYAIVRPGKVLPDQPGLHLIPAAILTSDLDDAIFRDVGFDCLIHLAWCTEPGKYWTSRENLEWLGATIDLVDRFAAAGGKRVVVAGSCAEYQWSSPGIFEEEFSSLAPGTLYGAAKLATWQLLQPICRVADIQLIWGRIFFPYGPGESPVRLMPSILSAMLSNLPVKCSHGRQQRDFIHADDVASALAHLASSDVASGAYNLSSGSSSRIRDVVRVCQEVTGSSSEIVYGAVPVARDEPKQILGVNSKLLGTGWEPEWTMRRGVSDSVEHLVSDARS